MLVGVGSGQVVVAWEGVAGGMCPLLVVPVVCKGRALWRLMVEEEEEGRRLRGSGTRPGIRGLLVLFGGGSRMGRGEGEIEGPGEVSFSRGEGEGFGVNARQ